MRKISESSYTGNDRVLFYDMGDDVIRVVHLQEWDDIDSSYRREGGEKYNVVAHDVCVYGYDGQRGYLSDEPNDFRKSSVCGWGQSVHDSLRSCGFKLLVNPEGVAGCGNVRIESEHDGAVIAHGTINDRTVRLVIAEAMYGFGAGDRVHDESGSNARELLKSARSA